MKTVLVAAGVIIAASGTALARTDTPGIDQRQANQERRIDQGVASGQLTRSEAAKLERQQARINLMEDRAKADGIVTRRERARLHAALDRSSRNIFRQKHDRQRHR